MVRVLSIDVGIRNLAFCEFELISTTTPHTSRILRWEVVDVIDKVKPSFDELSDALLRVLDDRFCGSDDTIHHVIIENQPVTMNPKIKSIAIMIYTFFRSVNMYTGTAPCVRFISAQRKLHTLRHLPHDMILAPSAKLPYAEKKRLAQVLCRHYLDTVMCDATRDRWSPVLAAAKKKDDLCDSFLQGVAFMERELTWMSWSSSSTTTTSHLPAAVS